MNASSWLIAADIVSSPWSDADRLRQAVADPHLPFDPAYPQWRISGPRDARAVVAVTMPFVRTAIGLMIGDRPEAATNCHFHD